ncbi:MAG: TonB-dependent receptor plug domain-containing protein [Bacteroidales bacterium]|nr:TonB-dependent receptor plug domain-containing protein [Bacteroidales bacterium]
MRFRTHIFLLLGFSSFTAMGQGITDTVFHIHGVSITAEQIFIKEQAGMKQTEVDSSVIQDKLSLSLSELLSENTSVFIKNHGRGALATASLRGTSASHTQVSWNGININSPMAGMVDFSLIPVYIIDELHLKHGSASLADRSGGIGGSININNRARWNETKSIGYLQAIGSYRTFDEFLQLGTGNKKIQSKTRIYHNYSRNNYTYINRGVATIDPSTGAITNPVDTNDHAAYKRYGILQELYFRPGSNQLASLKYWGQYADRTIPRPTSYEGPDNSNLNRQVDRDHRVVADWKYYGDFGRLMLRSGFADKGLDYNQMNQVPGLGLIPAIWSESKQQSLYNSFSYSGESGEQLSWEGQIDLNHHRVGSADSVSGAGYNGSRNELSTRIAIRKSFKERLNLNLMLRQEWVDGRRLPLIPFLGMDIRLIKGVDLLLKGNIARNYHLPALNDLFWQPGGNPGLRPEEGFTMEGGVVYQQDLSGQLLKTELTFYRSDIANWIIWIPSYRGYWEPQNILRVLSKGMECNLQLQGNFSEFRYKLVATYGYTRAVNLGDPLVWSDGSYGKQLAYIPLHSGNVMVQMGWGHFFFTYQYNAYSERYTTSSNDVSRRDRLYPYFMNDLSAGTLFDLKQMDLSLELKLNNLFNESYHTILYRPMPGRNFQLVIKIQF